ncbi:5215_t:CDS:1, partial [Ambispora gerdemannii]
RNINIISTTNKYWSPSLCTGGEWLIENIIAPHNLYKAVRKALKSENLLFIDQLLKYNNKMVTWKEYKQYTCMTNKGKKPIWFQIIEDRTINQERKVINNQWSPPTSSNHLRNYSVWSPLQQKSPIDTIQFDD